MDWHGRKRGDSFRVLERQSLGNQLTDHHEQIRDHNDHKDNYIVFPVPILQLTREALKESGLSA